ncbi:DotH/IcmK family type IV secretion protein [Psychrobacter sp. AOP31-A1-22]|uniref:DotH/IcmK family type IV secretion protein n=1 Tax=Psychrobacter sp. AOP31-A1-22 TaxID=3457696 RepID=UPI004035BAFD
MLMTKKSAITLLSLSLLTTVATAEGLPPPTTIDFGTIPSSPAIDQAPAGIRPEIAPSTSSLVADQVTEYQLSQLTPEQMFQLKQQQLEKDRITSNPYLRTPNPVVRSLAVSLNPGETPPIIRVSKNMLTSIVFTDTEGNPWYIEKVALNRNQFSDAANLPEGDEEEKLTNILTLEPNEAIAYGNVSVTLKDKALPVILLVASGQADVDVRVDARIPGRNPDAVYRPGVSPIQMTASIDNDALSFLDGAIPADAEPLISSDQSAQGWKFNDSLYVKTRMDLLHPNYMSRASTADGVSIYRFDGGNANGSITLMQRHGQPVTVSFEPAPYYQYSQ